MKMIEINNVTKKFGENIALSDINLKFNTGEVIALIGENGAGKSTLMRILCGYIDADKGNVRVFENDITKNRLRALEYLGYVPEISSLYADMTVYDFLDWIAKVWDIKNREAAIINVAKEIDITDVLDKKNDTLSKGYKKRVEIASALIHHPKLLVLDEPTDGLDPNQKHEIRNFIKEYAKQNIVLVSTHVLEDADVANRVVMLAHGKIIKDTSIQEFKKISSHKNLSEAFRILTKKKQEEL